jgi:hypothetical protein
MNALPWMRRMRPLALIAMCAALVHVHCGNPSLADGTHTGNPDVSACAAAIRDVSLSSSHWHVDAYIAPERLSPSAIDPREAGGPVMAKRSASVLAWSDTLILIDTLYREDTVLVEKQQIIRDTLVETRIETDTVDTIIDGRRYTHIEKSLIEDSIYVNDTVAGVDTLIYRDTIMVQDTLYGGDLATPAPAESRDGLLDSASWKSGYSVEGAAPAYQYSVIVPETRQVQHVFRSPTGNLGAIVANPHNYDVRDQARSDIVELSAAYQSDSGAAVSVVYADADGDGLLFTADSGLLPRSSLAEQRRSSDADQSLTAVFDAGLDVRFESIADNAVLYLTRVRRENGGDTSQTVRYESRGVDSMVLMIADFGSAEGIESKHTRFYSAAGARRSSGDDRLVGLSHTRRFRSATLYRLDLQCTPLSPRQPTESLGAASFSAAVTFQDGAEALFEGTIDENGIIVGNYVRDGESLRITIDQEGHQTVAE